MQTGKMTMFLDAYFNMWLYQALQHSDELTSALVAHNTSELLSVISSLGHFVSVL